MSLRRAEPRFALPALPRRAAVLGELVDWTRGLEQAGVEVVPPQQQVELVVAPGALAGEAAALGPDQVVVEGADSGALAAAGYSVRRLVSFPDREQPVLIVRPGQAAATRYAIGHFRRAEGGPRRLRNRVAAELLARGAVPPGCVLTVLGSRRPGQPALVAEAAGILGVARPQWFLQIGPWAHPHSRAVFHVLAPGSSAPGWVVKFSRVPGLERLFDDDERGLRLASELGPSVSAHAPRQIGRFELSGLHASIETEALGEPMVRLLRSDRPRAVRLGTLERVAAWTLELGRSTTAGPDRLEPERRRLASEVVPSWDGPPIPAGIVESLAPVAATFEHGDLWADNVLVHGESFTVVDWEAARSHGWPLWDLLYLLVDGLALVDGIADQAARDRYVVALCRGEHPSAEILFRWLRKAVDALELPAAAVGPLTLLLWLDHAAAERRRGAALDRLEPGRRAGGGLFERLAALWLTEPGLGPGWDAWQR
jgi:hypothetical protein